jgi:peptidoglycan/LPS O-acetylase OafA/YrhL
MHAVPPSSANPETPALANFSSRRIELDFLRGIAILIVMFGHFHVPNTGIGFLDSAIGIVRGLGTVGVNLFFTLSGFLVGSLLLKEYKNFGSIHATRFLTRRALKIWPSLYFLILVHALTGHHDLNTFLWQNLLHVQNYFGSSLAQTWSLAVEEHFYLFLAFSLALYTKKSANDLLRAFVLIAITSIALRFYAVHSGLLDAAFRQTQYRMDSLFYGVILAVVYVFKRNIFDQLASMRKTLFASFCLLIFGILATHLDPVLDRLIGYCLQGIGFSLLLIQTLTSQSAFKRTLIYRGIAWVGIYSYGIYLWHSIALGPGDRVIQWLNDHHVPGMIGLPLVWAFQLTIALMFGYITTRLVEWPFLRLRERLFPPTEKTVSTSKCAVPATALF